MALGENDCTSLLGSYWFHRRWPLVSLTVSVVLIVYSIRDYYGPSEISLQTDTIRGIPVLRAPDQELVVQDYDDEGNLWVTRGMWAYRLQPGSNKLFREHHIPTGLSIFWLRNFSFIRRLTFRPECVELSATPHGEAFAMSAGRMWYRPNYDQEFEETLVLRHYGIGVGQGIRNDGFDRLDDGTILFGEYFDNEKRSNVYLYCSENNGKTWRVVHEYSPGRIGHVHAVQKDPYEDKAWILTGDHDNESMIAWTNDGGNTLNLIGQGSQRWRATQLAFTESALFWGADTGNIEESGIYRWDRKTHELTKLASVMGSILYATKLANGTIVMSTDREGHANEKDDKTRLWVITEGNKVASIVFGTWANHMKYAKLRFQRRQGSSFLALTVLNHEEYNNDLLIVSENALREAIEGSWQ